MFESLKLRIKPITNILELDEFESQVFQSLNDKIESDFQLLGSIVCEGVGPSTLTYTI